MNVAGEGTAYGGSMIDVDETGTLTASAEEMLHMSNNQVSRRQFLLGSSLTLGTAMLAACGAASTPAPAAPGTVAAGSTAAGSPEPITLRYWVCWAGEYADHG